MHYLQRTAVTVVPRPGTDERLNSLMSRRAPPSVVQRPMESSSIVAVHAFSARARSSLPSSGPQPREERLLERSEYLLLPLEPSVRNRCWHPTILAFETICGSF